MTMLQDLLSRKFLYAILALVLAFVLCIKGYITGQEFLSSAEIIGAAYILGNVVSKVADK